MRSSLDLRIRIKSEAIRCWSSASRTCTVVDWMCGGYNELLDGEYSLFHVIAVCSIESWYLVCWCGCRRVGRW